MLAVVIEEITVLNDDYDDDDDLKLQYISYILNRVLWYNKAVIFLRGNMSYEV